jgi:all-trans-8'-apo-beta-carotenal 15,15'-oxygenase
VPRPEAANEDDACLLYLRFVAAAATTELLANAANLRALARLRCPFNIPLGFYGLWRAARSRQSTLVPRA